MSNLAETDDMSFDWRNLPNAPKSGEQLCRVSDLKEDEPKFFALAAATRHPFVYIVIKQGPKFQVFLNRCPHKNLPLGTRETKPTYVSGQLTCIQHKAVFSVDTGQCVKGVCPGKSMFRIDVKARGDGLFAA